MDFNGGLGDVLVVELDGAFYAGECAANGRNHQVLDGELSRRMRGINLPGGSFRGRGQGKTGCQSGGDCDAREKLAHGCCLLK